MPQRTQFLRWMPKRTQFVRWIPQETICTVDATTHTISMVIFATHTICTVDATMHKTVMFKITG